MSRNTDSEAASARSFASLQDKILQSFGASEPSIPILRCRNATQTSVVLEWDPIDIATSELLGLSLYRNGQKAGAIPRPLSMQSTKISGLAIDTEYAFHLVLRTTAGTYISEKVPVRTHKMTDLSGVTITMGVMPGATRDALLDMIERIGAKTADEVRIDTTHFVTTEGRGAAWERAVEMNIPVVRPEWVDACERAGRILGVTNYYLDAVMPLGSGMRGLGDSPHKTSTIKTQASMSSTTTRDMPERPRNSEVTTTGRRSNDSDDQQARDSRDSKQQRQNETDSGTVSPMGPDDEGSESPVSSSSTDKDLEDKGKALASPDGTSFQDVAL